MTNLFLTKYIFAFFFDFFKIYFWRNTFLHFLSLSVQKIFFWEFFFEIFSTFFLDFLILGKKGHFFSKNVEDDLKMLRKTRKMLRCWSERDTFSEKCWETVENFLGVGQKGTFFSKNVEKLLKNVEVLVRRGHFFRKMLRKNRIFSRIFKKILKCWENFKNVEKIFRKISKKLGKIFKKDEISLKKTKFL